jgi:hypothetical protein
MTRRKKPSQTAPFVFTQETLHLTEEAITLFEQPLHRADRQNPKVALAEETIKQIKEKLALMKQSIGFLCLTTFDYNEKLLLVQALRAYSLVLLSLPMNAQQAREIHLCSRIAASFADEDAEAERARPDL